MILDSKKTDAKSNTTLLPKSLREFSPIKALSCML